MRGLEGWGLVGARAFKCVFKCFWGRTAWKETLGQLRLSQELEVGSPSSVSELCVGLGWCLNAVQTGSRELSTSRDAFAGEKSHRKELREATSHVPGLGSVSCLERAFPDGVLGNRLRVREPSSGNMEAILLHPFQASQPT